MSYLDGISERQVREALVEGLAFLYARQHHGRATFDYKDVVGQIARALVPQQSENAAHFLAENQALVVPDRVTPLSERMYENDDNRKLLGAIWGLIADGVLFPRLHEYRPGHPHLIATVTLTEKGERILSSADEHPLHPKFISRFRAKAPTTSDAVVAHLEDAVSCLEQTLLRPSLMMIGLANEETIRVTHAALVHQGKVNAQQGILKTRDLLNDIEGVARAWQNKDERHRLTIAISNAEIVRVERNDAAHPGKKITDELHIEGQLAQVAHHCATMWEVVVKQAVASGFIVQ